MTRYYFVYIITNYYKTVLYIGVTNDLKRRINEHFRGLVLGFSTRYKCKYLVYYELHTEISLAISREKEIKKWSRKKKLDLIKKMNPNWKFMNEDI